MRRNQKGFTLVEMLVVITIIGILAALAIPNMTRARVKAKEAEVKANLHVIQAALERFYTDHSQYPAYIGGGDQGGWYRFQARMEDINNEDARWLIDPLIEKGYIEQSYPKNPFVSQSESHNIVKLTGGNTEAGTGDPRFGMGGDIAGNGLDDPRFLNVLTIGGLLIDWRILDNGEQEPWDIEQIKLHWSNSRIGAEENLIGLLDYRFGGNQTTDLNNEIVSVNDWWPGNFFYRSMGDFDLAATVPGGGSEMRVFNFRFHKFNTYMLGGYGAKTTPGKDIIRNIYVEGETYYSKPMLNYPDIWVGLPEVFGGGDEFTHPVFPPKDIAGNDWLYGAPDGIKDGVVAVLTGSGTTRSY